MSASLSQQDRDWVKAIVKAAVTETLLEAKKCTDSRIEAHVKGCPHALRGKAIIAGIVVVATVAGGALFRALGSLFGG